MQTIKIIPGQLAITREETPNSICYNISFSEKLEGYDLNQLISDFAEEVPNVISCYEVNHLSVVLNVSVLNTEEVMASYIERFVENVNALVEKLGIAGVIEDEIRHMYDLYLDKVSELVKITNSDYALSIIINLQAEKQVRLVEVLKKAKEEECDCGCNCN